MTYLPANLSELWIITPGFDDLLLNGDTTDDAGFSYTIDAIDEGASWDSPVPVDVAVQRWMTDGAVAATQGHENRTPTFQVRISADTSGDLAAGEAALVKRSARPCRLMWISPEGYADAPATVFEVWTWHLSHGFSGSDERHVQRYYTLTFTAKPWVCSQALTTAVAPIPPPTTTTVTIDACTSTTGWTGSPVAPTTSGGAVKVSFIAGGGWTVSLTRTGAVSGLAATPYLMIDISSSGDNLGPNRVKPFLYLDGGSYITAVAQLGTVYYFKVPTGMTSFTTMKILGQFNHAANTTFTWSIADVSRTDTIGSVGSAKQLSRTLDVGGSVKTSGSIHLASPSATNLGNCLVYTTESDNSGFSSAMRPYRATGNTVTPDATCVSGNREAFVNAGASAGTISYTLPAGTPEATYVAVGRFIFDSAATMSLTFGSLVGSNGGTFSSTVTASGAGVVWAVLGVIQAPWVALPSNSAITPQFTASATATTGTHAVDEFYLLDVTRGSFTLVTGVTRTNLWIDAPDADQLRNRPAIYLGNQADRSDALTPPHTTILSLGDHDLDPDGVTLFTVTDGVDNAAATASFYHRWHTHAGD